jgi:two-component system OmpR family sensor kinase
VKRVMLSLRARLLVLQLIVFGSLILLASPVTYITMSQTLRRDRDQYLASMARTVSAEFVREMESASQPRSSPLPCLPNPVLPDSPDPDAMHRPRHMLVCDELGQVLCSDGENAPLAPDAVRLAFQTQSPAYADVHWSAEFLRIIAWPFQDADGRTLIMEVGTSYLVIKGALRKGLLIMGLISAVAFLCLITGSYFLTRNAFDPIKRIIGAVEGIDEAKLEARLPIEPREDEVGRLVAVINRMLERLERAFEAQSRFSSDVAHEIRSPLTALRGQIEVTLRKERSSTEYRKVLEGNLGEVLRLSRLAEDLMSLAKGDAGVLHVRPVAIDLHEMLHGVLVRLKPTAEEKDIQLRLLAPEEVPFVGDPDLLGRLVENLVDNALIHSPHMGEVIVRLERDSAGITISVEDKGTGIPPEDLPRIFDRFYRVDLARSRDVGGTGLGLAIVQQIATVHNGSIDVTSVPGQGSTFRVRFPANKPSAPIDRHPAPG